MIAAPRIVGIGIAKSDDHIYCWFDDGVVTSGNSSDFEKYRHPYPYTLPNGKHPADVLAISIASNDHIYAWYKDGTVSSGTSSDLARYQSPVPFVLPSGKTTADIVGIGIAGSNDHVYSWYRDGSASEGTSSRLDKYHAAYTYHLPSGVTTDDIVEIDIAKNDHVYAWYRNGTATAGTSSVLDRYLGSFGYIANRTLYRWWGPGSVRIRRPPLTEQKVWTGNKVWVLEDEVLSRLTKLPLPHQFPGGVEPRDVGTGASSPPPALQVDLGGSLDPMVAVGENFMIASDTGNLVFMDKNAVQLPVRPLGGVPTSLSTGDFFSGFVADKEADGSFNWSNINREMGFPQACDKYPATYLDHFCIGEFYDTRVIFDRATKRFFVIAAARNAIWSNFSGAYGPGKCGFYQLTPPPPPVVKTYMSAPNQCLLMRRYVALAVSKSEDPRDGFHQYMLAVNMPADWPWIGVHGSRVVITHQSAMPEPPEWTFELPVAEVLDTNAVVSGVQHPPYFLYSLSDLKGMAGVLTPNQQGDVGILSLLLAYDGSSLRIFSLSSGGDGWSAPPLASTSVDLGDQPPGLLASAYRNKRLYLAGTYLVEKGDSAKRYSIRVVRIPLAPSGSDLNPSTNPADGYRDQIFGRNSPQDDPSDRFSYDRPSLAVNGNGDILIGYRRMPFASTPPLFPEARYSLWRVADSRPSPSALLHAGAAACTDQLDYTTTTVDFNDSSFWVALPFANSSGHFDTAIGVIVP